MSNSPGHGLMDPASFGLFEDKSLVPSDARVFPDPIGWGLGCSAVLHLFIALLFAFGLTSPLEAPPPVDVPVPVELVQFDQEGTSPGRQKEVGKQQEKPPPDSPEPQPSKRDPIAEVKPQQQKRQPDLSKRELPKRDSLAEGKTPRKTQPAHEDIDTLLRVVENSHREMATLPGQSRKTGPPLSESAGTGHDAGEGHKGTVAVKEFIRAQIERHWEFDLGDLGATDLVISLHLELTADGSVRRADVIDDPRYSSDPHYRSLATSARNAALLSSPLHLPPGTYDAFKDITLNFDPRDALR